MLHGITTFKPLITVIIDNGKDSTNCQLEASGKDSTIIGLLRLGKMSVIGNTVIQWDRGLVQNNPHKREIWRYHDMILIVYKINYKIIAISNYKKKTNKQTPFNILLRFYF